MRVARAMVGALALVASGPVYTAGLTTGQYALREVKGRAPPRSVCVADLNALYRAAHGEDRCRYFTVEQKPDRIRVSYECAGGSGQLSVRSVTPRSANVTAQGVRGDQPYAVALVARRTGDCR